MYRTVKPVPTMFKPRWFFQKDEVRVLLLLLLPPQDEYACTPMRLDGGPYSEGTVYVQ